MSTSATSGDVIWLLKAYVTGAHDETARIARELGVGSTDLRALDHLLEHGPAGPNELGRRLGLTSPAATALADRLERAGHVERVRDADDRRRIALIPTQHAVAEARRVLGPRIGPLLELVDELPPEELRVVAAFLARALEIQQRPSA